MLPNGILLAEETARKTFIDDRDPVQIAHWRKAALEQLQESFVDGRTRKARDDEFDSEVLYEQIGRLKMELEWMNKKAGMLG